jgi:DNA (cytosine-5)-methyltransferase 1
MTAYYNEIDPYAAQWLRNLIEAGHIALGIVDERSIEDVTPNELKHYTQCHFFAGIGVWSLALRRAGWPDDRPVWTGSCPCQPFSSAGKGGGFDDERHLWPAFHHLIEQCRPATVIGEQVASKDAEPWLDLVQTDLEAVGYAFGAVPFPSASVGAPHIRDRLYWVADTEREGLEGRSSAQRSEQRSHGQADALRASSQRPSATNGFWADADWLLCRDGKWRPVEPGTFPLAHGATSRVGRLRAYGNAINAEAARVFIESLM